MKRLANLALWTVIFAMLAVTATVTIIPNITGLKAVNIIAGSMGEALPFGSLAYIDPAKTPTVGDIVTYRFGEMQPVSHRVVSIGPDFSGNSIAYTTQGDRNKTPDEREVPPENIIGVVVASVPTIGSVTTLLSKFPVQLFIALVCIGLWWVGSEPTRTQRRMNALIAERKNNDQPVSKKRLESIHEYGETTT